MMGINFCDSTQAANFQLWYVPNSCGSENGMERGRMREPELERVVGGLHQVLRVRLPFPALDLTSLF